MYANAHTLLQDEEIREMCPRVRKLETFSLPDGSLTKLCANQEDDWICNLEIDYFHAEISMNSVRRFLTLVHDTTHPVLSDDFITQFSQTFSHWVCQCVTRPF